MPSDGEGQTKEKTKKRRHISLPETESSDECDSPNVKTRRKQQISNFTSALMKITKDKSGELEATCSSQNVQFDKKVEPQTNGKMPNNDTNTAFVHVEQNIKLSQSLKSPIRALADKDAAAASSKNGEKVDKINGESGDQCPICWTPFTNQEVAIPSSCNHCFCLQCILEWSKNTNTCPVDRQVFNKIEVHQSFGGKATRCMPIETRRQEEDNIQEDVYNDSDEEPWYSDSEADHYFDPNNYNESTPCTSDQDMNDGTFLSSPDYDENDERVSDSILECISDSMQNNYDVEIGSPSTLDGDDGHCFSPQDDEDEQRFSTLPRVNDEDDGSNSFSPHEDEDEGRNSFSPHEDEDEGRNSFSPHEDEDEGGNSFSPHEDVDEGRNSFSPHEDEDESRNYFSPHENEDDERSSFSPCDDEAEHGNSFSSHENDGGSIYCSSHDSEEASPNVEIDSSNADDSNAQSFDDNDSLQNGQDYEEPSSLLSFSSNRSDSRCDYTNSSNSDEISASPSVSQTFDQSDSSVSSISSIRSSSETSDYSS